MKDKKVVRDVIAVILIVLLLSTAFYVIALNIIRSTKKVEGILDLHCVSTEEGDFLIIVHADDGIAIIELDAIIRDAEGNEVNRSRGLEYYMRDPNFAPLNITFNDRDRDGMVSDADYFLLPSKENGGVAQVNGEFIVKSRSGDICGKTTLENNHNYLDYPKLNSSWNFIHVDENVSLQENQVATENLVVIRETTLKFQLTFQWPVNDSVDVSMLVDNVSTRNFSSNSSMDDVFDIQWKHDYKNDSYRSVRSITVNYTIEIKSSNSDNTILIACTEVEYIYFHWGCFSFQMNIFTILLSLITVGWFGYCGSRKKRG